MDDLVATSAGRVRGIARSPEVLAFLGIPYAAPPFGADRFRAPRPAAGWAGVRDARSFGPVAPQSARLPGMPTWSPGDEDVLTVNVWTRRPAADRPPSPVLCWLHGGAFTFGSAAQPDFDGTTLASAGLVVVTCNYRLGFEGFGRLAGFPDDRGLLDQLAALHWVRDEIAAFGGDPDQVTLAGQSAGATSAACLLGLPEARGLFRRVIAHSPVGVRFTRDAADDVAERIAAVAGLPSVTRLSEASPQTLVAASDAVSAACRADPAEGRRYYDSVLYGPVPADGGADALLAASPEEQLRTGLASDVDLLVCRTADEHWLLHAVDGVPSVVDEAGFADFVAAMGIPEEIVLGLRRRRPAASIVESYLDVFGEFVVGRPAARLIEEHVGAGGRAWSARFARRLGPGGPVPAWHNADLPFAFGNLDVPGAHFLIGGPPGEADRALSRRMTASWVGFATDGDPGWPAVPAAVGPSPTRIWQTPHDSLDRRADDGAVRRDTVRPNDTAG
ncbi:carboxylesterase/lipase family protein [Actinoalloteichus fjordicus]|uniref:Carboxylic ester hydrolase n=1 Tax=Actinoalloteichus fjordicus TaxID=1612552 RepID=A0AAC9LBL5_9PSEU|nr:carboxylesterase family protein [Actinoalloteichus fjordicus]APU14611.1 carboxylesterase type B [Actinoalloteichus fjordicus]